MEWASGGLGTGQTGSTVCVEQVGQAGKRLSPSDPDKSRPKPPTLPWFDMLRFVWRGNVDLTARY